MKVVPSMLLGQTKWVVGLGILHFSGEYGGILGTWKA